MYYLILNYAEANPEFNNWIHGKIICQAEDFGRLLEISKDLVTTEEANQCKISLHAIGTYYSSLFKISIVDTQDLKNVFPELLKQLKQKTNG